jgi:hypothetical protein
MVYVPGTLGETPVARQLCRLTWAVASLATPLPDRTIRQTHELSGSASRMIESV